MAIFESKTWLGSVIWRTARKSPAPWVPAKKMFEGTGVSKKYTNRVRPSSSGHLQKQVLTLNSWHLAISASNSDISEKIREKTRWITTSPGLQSRQLITLVRMAIELQKQTRSDAKVFFNAVDNGIHKCIKIHLVWFVYRLVDGLWGELRGSAIDRSTTCKSQRKNNGTCHHRKQNMKKYALSSLSHLWDGISKNKTN